MLKIKHIHNIAIVVIALAMTTMLCQCGINNEQSKYFLIPDEGWLYDNSLSYTPLDSLPSDNILPSVAIVVRHTNDYEYSNLWVELSYTMLPDATFDTYDDEDYEPSDSIEATAVLMTDTFNIKLADDYGRWYGKGIGVGFQKADTVLRYIPVDLTKPLSLRHIMRVDNLKGIEQMGIVTTY